MELDKIVVRVFFAYIFLLLLMRLSGKHTVSQGRACDFVVALILGDMIDDAMWSEIPLAQFAVGTGTIVLMQLIVSIASARSTRLEAIFEGTPTMFMQRGSLLRKGLREERVSRREAEEMIRIADGLEQEQWNQIESARVEQSGEPSVIRREWARPAQKQDREKLREARR